MRFARIKDGIVKDVIIVDDLELLPLFEEGFDCVLEVSGEPGSPGPKDLYNPDTGFSKPDTGFSKPVKPTRQEK